MTSGCTAIGIDVGGRSIRALQLSASRTPAGQWELVAAVRLDRLQRGGPPDQRECARLRQVLYRQGFTGNRVLLTVAPDKLMAEVLKVPPRKSGAPVDQIVRMGLARSYTVEPASFQMAFWELPTIQRPNQAAEVMAVGCDHQFAGDMLDLFASNGMEVQVLDTRAWAIARAIEPLIGPDQQTIAVLDIDWDVASLMLMDRQVVLYERLLPEVSLQPLHEVMSRMMGQDPALADYALDRIGLPEVGSGDQADGPGLLPVQRRAAAYGDALVKEITLCLDYAVRQYPQMACQKLLLVGQGAAVPGLAGHLDVALSLPVQIAGWADRVTCAPWLTEQCADASLTAALGMALYDREAA